MINNLARFRTVFLANAYENLFYQMIRRLEKTKYFQKKRYLSMIQS